MLSRHTHAVLPMLLIHLCAFAGGAPSAPGKQETIAILQRAQQLHGDGKLAPALSLYEEVIPRLRAEGEHARLGGALYLISLAYTDLGEYSKALAAGSESAEIRKTTGDKTGQADSANSIGLALMNLGDYPKALSLFSSALDLYREVRDFEEVITVLNNAANVLLYQGKYLDALDRYQQAMDLIDRTAKEEWNSHQRQVTTANMAVLFQKLGRYDLALDLYSRLRSMTGVLSPSETGRVLANLGAMYRHLGDPVKALETYRMAEKSFAVQRNYDGEMGVLKNIGIAQALDLGNLDEALVSFTRVLQLARQTSNRREMVQSLLYTGEVHRRLFRADQARREFAAALSGARDLGTAEEEWKALYGLGQVDWNEGASGHALGHFREAIDLIESVRSRIRVSSLRAEFLADKRAVYDSAIKLVLDAMPASSPADPASLEDLHRLMERARARNFKDQLYDSLESLRDQSNPELAGRLREVRAQMALNLNQQLHAAEHETGHLREQYSALEGRYVEIERALAGYSASRLHDSDLTIREIQLRLPAGALLFESWTGAGSIGGIWMTGAEAGIVRERLGSEGDRAIRSCAERMSNPDAADWQASCAPVCGLLLKALQPHLNEDRTSLIFVPDERLAFLPIEALSLPGAGQPLIERLRVSYLPSSSMIAASPAPLPIRMRLPWMPTLLAFGDPSFPLRRQPAPAVLDDAPAALPHSRYEVESIAQELPGRKSLHLGRDALKKYLFAADSRAFRLIHLSTHARADLENPQGSRILFSPEANGAADNLFLGEILNLDLRGTELVTLSACETGIGRAVVGEGPQDFSRAFLMTGARSAVSTLWRVADQPTAEFMRQFYFYLSQGNAKSDALRKAKLRFVRSQTQLAHPFYWAAFVLSGEATQPMVWPMSWGTFLAVAAAILLASIALASLFFVSKFRR